MFGGSDGGEMFVCVLVYVCLFFVCVCVRARTYVCVPVCMCVCVQSNISYNYNITKEKIIFITCCEKSFRGVSKSTFRYRRHDNCVGFSGQ